MFPLVPNPADLVSRGMNPDEIQSSTLWWCGPEFLLKQERWPSQDKYNRDKYDRDSDTEFRKMCAAATTSENCKVFTINSSEKASISSSSAAATQEEDKTKAKLPLALVTIARFSNYNRLVNVVVYCIRFMLNCRKTRKYRNFKPIDPQERHEAELRLLRIVQQQAFPAELKALTNLHPVSKFSKISNLNPFIDCNGILRVGGRLSQSNLTYDQQHQIIVPKGHFSKLLLIQIHQLNLHCGPQIMLSTARQRFWILGARSQTRTIIHDCVRCFKQRPRLLQQLMGDLPQSRANPSRPFKTCGIDYAGPFYVRLQPRSKYPVKVYICIISCFATRACHIELVKDLTTKSFLAAFRRFISRRGTPATVYSDNATNFVGARNELAELRNLFISESHLKEVQEFCSTKGISWLHIPPRSPHWGGLWESTVKQFKYHLKRATVGMIFSSEALETIMCQIECILNSRPLTPLSNNIDDPEVLTPGHFLIGEPLNLLPEPCYQDQNFNRLDDWQQRQYLIGKLWKRFYNDYIMELQVRAKWKTAKPDIKEGAIVIVHEDNIPPSKWRLGKIIATHPGTDQRVRMVTVKTTDGTYQRAITKIAPLPFDN